MGRIRALIHIEHIRYLCSRYLSLQSLFYAFASFFLVACDLNLGYFGQVEIQAKNPAEDPNQGTTPNIYSISPNVGLETGGTIVTITGDNFTKDISVTIGGDTCVIVAEVRSNRIICLTSASSTGQADIVVTNPQRQIASLSNAFTYEIDWSKRPGSFSLSSILPAHGIWSGGTQVTIQGNKIHPEATVSIGGVDCLEVNVNDERSSLTCTTSAYTSNEGDTVDVIIVNPDRTTTSLTGGFTYLPAPFLTSVSPSIGPTSGGTLITFEGNGFTDGISVSLDGIPCNELSILSFQNLTCRTPAHSAKTVDIAVSQGNDSDVLSQAFTYLNETIPTVNFTESSQTVSESTGTVTVTAKLSSAFSLDVSVPFVVSGTANKTLDHNLADGAILIAAGSLESSISFNVLDDSIDENTETIILTMGQATHAVLGTNTSHTVTLLDSSPPPSVLFPNAAQLVLENANTVNVTVLVTPISGLDVVVPFSVSGTSSPLVDHDLTSGNLTIPAGQSTGTISIDIIDDTLYEEAETIVLTMGTPTNALPGLITEHAITINDNDTEPIVNFATSQLIAEDSVTASVTASLNVVSAVDVTVPFTVSGTATNPEDHDFIDGSIIIYAGTLANSVSFNIVDDTLDEDDETIIASMGVPDNATQGSTLIHTIYIIDNNAPPTANFAVSPQTVAESIGPVTVSATINSVSALEVTIPFTVSGTATPTDDHNLIAGSITIPAGDVSGSISFDIVDDLLDEEEENVILTMGAPTNAIISTFPSHTVNITDNDDPPAVDFSSNSQTVNEDVDVVAIEVSLSAVSGRDINVPFLVSGTASNPEDHNLINGNILVPAGQSTGSISFNIVDDILDEDDETIIATMGVPDNATQGSTLIHTVKITDTSAPPTANFAVSAQTVTESIGPVTVSATINSVSALDVTIPFTLSGTATPTDDHNLIAGSITIPAGNVSGSISFDIVDDLLDEEEENVTLTMGAPTNATIGTFPTHTVSITDNDDPPDVYFSSASQSVDEGTSSVSITAEINAASERDITVSFNVGGSSSSPEDHDLTSGNISIPAGQLTGSITFDTVDDVIDEDHETIIISMGTPVNATAGTPLVHTVTIADNDSPTTISFRNESDSGGEGGGPKFVIELDTKSGLDISVPYTVGGTASFPSDHDLQDGSITIPAGQNDVEVHFDTVENSLDEEDKTIVVTLANPTNANKGTPNVWTYTILDDDNPPKVEFTADSQTVNEGVSTVDVAVTLDAVSGKDVTVPFSVSGTAVHPNDHNLADGSIVVPAGSLSNAITIDVIDDTIDENDESIIITMGTPINANPKNRTEHTITITDNDDPPTVEFDIVSQTENENTDWVQVLATLSSESSKIVTVDYTLSGTATNPEDHNFSNRTITFDAGTVNHASNFQINEDLLDENDETIIVTMSNPVGATIGAKNTHTLTITDNDIPSIVNFELPGSNFNESIPQIAIPIHLNTASSFDITVPITVSGTSFFPTDHDVINQSVTISAGDTSETIIINLVNDDMDEPNETIVLTMGSPTNAIAGNPSEHTLTIIDNDSVPVVNFDSDSQTVSDDGITVTVTATLAAESGLDVTVPFTVSGTASEPGDHNLVDGNILIPAGLLSGTTTFDTVADGIDEDDESIILTMGEPTNASQGTITVHTVTLVDVDVSPEASFTALIQNVNENIGSVSVDVNINHISGKDITIPFTVVGSAINPEDHNLANGNIIITASNLSNSVIFDIEDDDLDENTETVIVVMGTLINASQGTNTSSTININDNDPEPAVAFTASSQTVAENVVSVNVSVSLTTISGRDVSVPFTVGGTAINPEDHNLTDGTIVIPKGSISSFTIFRIQDDSLYEDTETVVLTMGSPTNASQGTTLVHTVTITDDDDAPTVGFTASQSVTEGDAGVSVTAALSDISSKDVTIPFTVSGTASKQSYLNWSNGSKSGSNALNRGNTDNSGLGARNLLAASTDDDNPCIGTENPNCADNTHSDFTQKRTHTLSSGDVIWDVGGNVWEWVSDNNSSVQGINGYIAQETWNGGAAGKLKWGPSGTYTEKSSGERGGFGYGGLNSSNGAIVRGGGQHGDQAEGVFYVTLFYSPSDLGDVMGFRCVYIDSPLVCPSNYVAVSANVEVGANEDFCVAKYEMKIEGNDDGDQTYSSAFVAESRASGTPWVNISRNNAISECRALGSEYDLISNAQWQAVAREIENAQDPYYDHNLVNGNIIIPAGTLSNSVSFDTVDDSRDEDDETVILTMNGPINATEGATNSHTVTILDNDAMPNISFTSGSQTLGEGTSSGTIEFVLSAVSGRDVTVPFTVSGISTSPEDHDLVSGDITIPAGTLSHRITFHPVDDTLDEDQETLVVDIQSPQHATLGAITTHTVFLQDNDLPPLVNFSNSQTVVEGDVVITFNINLSAPSSKSVIVPFTWSGTASFGSDHDLINDTVMINPGTETKFYAFNILDDSIDENNEEITISMGSITNGFQGSNPTHTITITDNDDAPSVNFATASQTVNEGTDNVTITAEIPSISGRDIIVPFTLSGTSTIGTDHDLTDGNIIIWAGSLTGTAVFDVVDDNLDENNETIILTMGNPTNGTQGTSTSHTVTITDNDDPPAVNFTETEQAVSEGGVSFSFTVTLSDVSGKDITIPFGVDGTALSGPDFGPFAGDMIISAGNLSGTATYDIHDDDLMEDDETININIGTPINASQGTVLSHTITILDNDSAPTVSFTADSQNVPESVDTISFTFSLSTVSGTDVTVPFTVSGTASSEDYVLADGFVIIPAGSPSTTKVFTHYVDEIDEDDETIIVTIGTPTNATPGPIFVHTVTIIDDDDEPIVNFAASQSVTEGDSGIIVTVSKSIGSDRDVTVPFKLSGTHTVSYVNWSNGSISGDNFLNYGHSDNSSPALAADAIGNQDDDPCVGTGNANCTDNTHSDFSQKRTHTLQNGNIIWDLAGNVFEYVKDDITTSQGDYGFASQEPWFAGGKIKWGPSGTYTSKDSGKFGGLGALAINAHAGAIMRGGVWDYGYNSGIFATNLNYGVSFAWHGQGFRCVYVTSPLVCPSNFVYVSANIDVGVNEDFCAAKYEMKIQGDDDGNQAYNLDWIAESRPSGTPWVQITRNQAINECQDLGAQYDLISNAQWQAVAREIENAKSTPDHNLTEGTITIPAGSLSNSVSFDTVDDILNENDETVILTMNNATNATEGPQNTHTVTIMDNDALPSVSFTGGSQTLGESAASGTIEVTLNTVSGRDVIVPFTVSGTATSPEDHDLASGSITIPEGTLSTNITFNPINDTLDEDQETLIVEIGAPVGATQGAILSHTVFLQDNDDMPKVNFSSANQSVSEGIGIATVTASLTTPSGKDVTVPFIVSGTAVNPDDHDLISDSVVIPAGSLNANIEINIVDDTLDEVDETITLSMNVPTNADYGTTIAHTITITDNNDAPTVNFTSDVQSVDEDILTAFVTVTLSAISTKTIEVPFTVSGTANNPSDHNLASGSIVINPGSLTGNTGSFAIFVDSLNEDNETIILTMGTPINANAGATNTHTLTITDNDPIPTVNFLTASQTVGEDFLTVSSSISLSAESGRDITVNYTVGGTASTLSDHNLSDGSIVIPAGSTVQNITFQPTNDLMDESDETVIITMGAVTNATKISPTEHTVTITDNDLPSTASFLAPFTNFVENDSNYGVLVQLDKESGFDIEIPYTISGTASFGSDHVLADGSITISAGDMDEIIWVDVNEDSIDEPNETIIITLGAPTNASLGTPNVHTFNLLDDDDPPTIYFIAPTQDLNEGDISNQFVVQLTSESAFDIDFDINRTGGTAIYPDDHNFDRGSYTIPAGTTTKVISFGLVHDALYENTETILVTLENVTNANLGLDSLTLNIIDDDPKPTIDFTAVSQTVDEGVGTVTVRITPNTQSGAVIQIPLQISGTAISPEDHSLVDRTVDIMAGSTGIVFAFTVVDDEDVEDTETVIIEMLTPTGADLGTITTQTVNITNNDSAGVGNWVATSITDVPQGRNGHSVIWTGSEMIVWGGTNVDSLDTGGRYDPMTDTWVATPSLDAPSVRSSQSAVWTGKEMIIWGGWGVSDNVDTGGRYDPVVNTWVATSTAAGVPTARSLHSAVWTGREMIIWGGKGAILENTGSKYDPEDDTWNTMSTTNSPSARHWHSAIWTGKEMIIWGGGEFFGPLADNALYRYSPNTDIWSYGTPANTPSARVNHSTVWTGKEMIIWGGYGESDYEDTGARYNPNLSSWVTLSQTDAPSKRTNHTAIWTGSKMIVWGGHELPNYYNTGAIYDPFDDSWTDATSVVGDVPIGRSYHCAIWTGKEMIIWGGITNDIGPPVNTGARYTPPEPANADTWTAMTDLSVNPEGMNERYYGSAVWTGSHMIVWGGHSDTASRLNTGGLYDPITNAWTITETTDAPSARSRHQAVWTGSHMIVWGGFDGNPLVLPTTGGAYDPVVQAWNMGYSNLTGGTGSPVGREYFTAVWTGKEMIVWGGYNDNSTWDSLKDGGRYDPTTDQWQATDVDGSSGGDGAPDYRHQHTAVWTGKHMIVWGGVGSWGYHGDGGLYDPSTDTWSNFSDFGSTESRCEHSAVWTGKYMIVWGGRDGNTEYNSGAMYEPYKDALHFQKYTMLRSTIHTGDIPTARYSHTAVWTGKEMIVWGGINGTNLYDTGATFTPESLEWKSISSTDTPPGRYRHNTVWTGKEMIIWGGKGQGGVNLPSGSKYTP